jgi:HSP20 family protein
METNYTDESHLCSVYPGGYFPVLEEAELQWAFQQSKKVNTFNPTLNLNEQDDCFKLEAALPGLHREDFFISIDEDVLSIAVLHRNDAGSKENCFQMPSFGYECFNRKLTLPSNAESTFIQAEYRKGILNMYLPKTNTPTRQAHINVVVY